MVDDRLADTLIIYVLWQPGSVSERLAVRVAEHFSGLGMERDGVSHRVPVRFRSLPIDPIASSTPGPIDWRLAKHNAVVLLHDASMAAVDEVWASYVGSLRHEMDARGKSDFYIPFLGDKGSKPLSSDVSRNTNYAHQYDYSAALGSEHAAHNHALLFLLYTLRARLKQIRRGSKEKEPIFVSHAKIDGDETAQTIVDYINKATQDIPLHLFYDAKQLMPGEDFRERFVEEIEHASLLAIVSDAYDSRPWCVFELTEAKKSRRPIILADVGRKRISRTYPYGANLSRVRVGALDAEAIETLMIEVLSEGLRCDLFVEAADDALRRAQIKGFVLPRPPELLDFAIRTFDSSITHLVYPDPPLALIEQKLIETGLRHASLNVKLTTLGELS